MATPRMVSILLTGNLHTVLNLQSLVKGIQGIIPGGQSVEDFAMATGTSKELAVMILDNLMQNGIGIYENGLIQFEESDKMRTGILAITMGAPIDEVSRLLDWQDFESLAAEVLESRDFETTRNVVLSKPRVQIDVIGIKSGIAVVIDCKHWKKMSQSALSHAVRKQVERTKQFVSREKVRAAIPAIVTLYQYETKFVDKVPIIPIHQLDAFCEELYGNMESFTLET